MMSDQAILIEQLRFRYPDQSEDQLRIRHWSVAKGARIFLRGESGAGKSTLLHLLAGLKTPQHGRLCVSGQDLGALTTAQRDRFRARHIGVIYQQFNLVPYLSVLDNVLLAPVLARQHERPTRQRAEDLLQNLHLSPSLFSRPAEQLSIGQQQRVAIARALINRPALLLADEPTSALDPRNREAFMQALMQQCEEAQTTLLLVSHDLALAAQFDQCVELAALNEAQEEQA